MAGAVGRQVAVRCDDVGMRGLTFTGLIVVLCGVLAGCTPAAEPIAALAVEDGRPVGLLYVCRDGFSQLSVTADKPDGSPDDGVFLRWHVVGDATAGVVEVPLLGPPPPGWRAAEDHSTPASATGGPAAEGEVLTELAAGVQHSLGGRGHRRAQPVRFTTADFPGIGADQVLVPNGRNEAKVVSRAAFTRTARATCE